MTGSYFKYMEYKVCNSDLTAVKAYFVLPYKLLTNGFSQGELGSDFCLDKYILDSMYWEVRLGVIMFDKQSEFIYYNNRIVHLVFIECMF